MIRISRIVLTPMSRQSCLANRYHVVTAREGLRVLPRPLRLVTSSGPPPWTASAFDRTTLSLQAGDGTTLFLRYRTDGWARLCDSPACWRCAARSDSYSFTFKPCALAKGDAVAVVTPSALSRIACLTTGLQLPAIILCICILCACCLGQFLAGIARIRAEFWRQMRRVEIKKRMRKGALVSEMRIARAGAVSIWNDCWLELVGEHSIRMSALYLDTAPIIDFQIDTLESISFGGNVFGGERMAWREMYLLAGDEEVLLLFRTDADPLDWVQGLQNLLHSCGKLDIPLERGMLLWLRARMRLKCMANMANRPCAAVLADIIRRSI